MNPDTEETSFPKMGVIGVLSVCVSKRYGHNRLLTIYMNAECSVMNLLCYYIFIDQTYLVWFNSQVL